MSSQTLAKPAACRNVRADPFVRCGAAASATALMLWLAHFPVNLAPLAWVALVPWLTLVRADLGWKSRYLFAWLGGYLFLLPAISWMRVAHDAMVYSWLGLSLMCSWYYPLALLLLRWLDGRTRLPLSVTTPLVWTALEFARGTLMGGFPWYFLGHSQHGFLALIQVADIGGVWAVTFVLAAVNGLIAEWLFHRLGYADVRPMRPQLVRVGALVVATFGYGGWRLATSEFATGPTVALLQTDIPQGDRLAAENSADGRKPPSIEEQTFVLSKRAREKKPDLIVWPETTFEIDDIEIADGAPITPDLIWERDSARELLRKRTDYVATNVLYGLNTRTYDRVGTKRRYNTALLMSADGTRRGRYDKAHLVPFGEYVPMREEWPWVRRFAPYDENYLCLLTPGTEATRFQFTAANGSTYTFGAVICYEDSYGELTRQYVAPGPKPPVDFLVNLTNDGWFYPTSEHEEHLAVSRFRAVECRRALLRAVNRGISAVVDGDGRVVALPGPTWAKSKGVLEVVTAEVPLDRRTSIYARIGDWLPWSCWGMIAAFGLWGRRCARCA